MSYFDDSDTQYVEAMKEYIEKLRKQQTESPEEARNDAREALIRTGVLEADGSPKKSIVSWG